MGLPLLDRLRNQEIAEESIQKTFREKWLPKLLERWPEAKASVEQNTEAAREGRFTVTVRPPNSSMLRGVGPSISSAVSRLKSLR